MQQVKVVLVDVNPQMVSAWRDTFANHPEVEIVHGSLLAQAVGAWVSPTNSRGVMDGGLDAAIKAHLGTRIQTRVRREIMQKHHGLMPVGYASCVETGGVQPQYLISTPTMVTHAENISETVNVSLACCAAFQAVHMQNAKQPGSIRSVALPGLGAGTGATPVGMCADLMWMAYNLFREQQFADFDSMREALAVELGVMDPTDPDDKEELVAAGRVLALSRDPFVGSA